jgi:hypothetical protein
MRQRVTTLQTLHVVWPCKRVKLCRLHALKQRLDAHSNCARVFGNVLTQRSVNARLPAIAAGLEMVNHF